MEGACCCWVGVDPPKLSLKLTKMNNKQKRRGSGDEKKGERREEKEGDRREEGQRGTSRHTSRGKKMYGGFYSQSSCSLGLGCPACSARPARSACPACHALRRVPLHLVPMFVTAVYQRRQYVYLHVSSWKIDSRHH